MKSTCCTRTAGISSVTNAYVDSDYVKNMTVQEVVDWVQSVGFESAKFAHEMVDGMLLNQITPDDLVDLGITSRLRQKKFYIHLEALKTEKGDRPNTAARTLGATDTLGNLPIVEPGTQPVGMKFQRTISLVADLLSTRIRFEDLKIEDKLGEGIAGAVYHGKWYRAVFCWGDCHLVGYSCVVEG